MTRPQAIDLLMLLSALESWAMSQQSRLPDYLQDRLASVIETLREQAIKPDHPPPAN